MPTAVVGFWNCTISGDWSELTMEKRIAKMQATALAVAAEGERVVGPLAEPVKSIFVAPEYAFADRDVPDSPKPAVQTDTAGYWLLRQALKKESTKYPSMLMAPGTIAHKNSHFKAMNTCMFALNGRVEAFDKKAGLGEVFKGDGLAFRPGTGVGQLTIQRPATESRQFAFQICKDATEVAAVPAPGVHVWIVVGQGVGQEAILRHPSHVLIVADPGSYGVFTKPNRTKEAFYRKDTILGCHLYFYLAQF